MSSDSKEPKGSFSADISDDAIEEALRAVERLEEGEGGPEPVEILDPEAPFGDMRDLYEDREAPSKEGAEEASGAETSLAPIPEAEPVAAPEAIEALEAENLALRETVKRLQGDIESLRRRAARERDEAERYGVEKLLLELIPVLDNLERAQRHALQGEEGLPEGVEMTRRMFVDALGRFGIESFSAVGEAFDPALHEAVEIRTTAEHPANVVLEEMVRGYRLHDRLVRPAMVCVAAPPADDAAE